MLTPERIFSLLLALPAFLAAFTIHEFAHAWMANRLGDDTPRREGRLTLDPMAHLDPIGSVMFVVTALSGYGIGWAKPVMTNPRNFENPRRDSVLVAIAGPVSNLLQVPIWLGLLFVFRIAAERLGWFGSDAGLFSPVMIVTMILVQGVAVNILLAAFNMIPIPPLDGHWVLAGLGPPAIGEFFDSIRPFSFMLLLMLSFTGILGQIIRPALQFADYLIGIALGGGFL